VYLQLIDYEDQDIFFMTTWSLNIGANRNLKSYHIPRVFHLTNFD